MLFYLFYFWIELSSLFSWLLVVVLFVFFLNIHFFFFFIFLFFIINIWIIIILNFSFKWKNIIIIIFINFLIHSIIYNFSLCKVSYNLKQAAENLSLFKVSLSSFNSIIIGESIFWIFFGNPFVYTLNFIIIPSLFYLKYKIFFQNNLFFVL